MADHVNTFAGCIRIHELMRLEMWEHAEAACRELLQVKPQEAEAWFCLGIMLMQRGLMIDAEGALRRVLALSPQRQAAANLLCLALYEQRRWEDSAEACRQALALDPGDATAWSLLGGALLMLKNHGEAQVAYERSLALAPDRVETQVDYGRLFCEMGLPERAAEILRGACSREARLPAAWVWLSVAYGLLDDWEQALAASRQAVSLAPHDREAQQMLTNALIRLWRNAEAEICVKQMIARNPQSAADWQLLGSIRRQQGNASGAIEAMRQAFSLAANPDIHGMLLTGLQYADDVTPQGLFEAHRQWNRAYAAPLSGVSPSPVIPGRSTRPLRLGFASLDFAFHPIGFLALRGLECLDKSECSVVCYCDRVGEDEFTSRFRRSADIWRTTAKLSADELAKQILGDEIDVLIDLMGHTGKRLLTFARRPAPVQATWLGYVGTTGLEAMDYLLADRFHVREGEEQWYSERVLRMPNGYACYGPSADAPEVGPLPAAAMGQVTFGCFNNPAKFAPSILAAWAEILRLAPNSRLLLKYGGLHEPNVQQRIREHFVQRGIAAERIVMEGWSPHRELLAAYNRVDIGLDTQPYSGGLTTCEALWMGVPVITFPGRTFAGRHSVSHLSNAGYPQFIADDLAGYVELAVSWANRLPELATLRTEMRERVRRSPLCDAPQFANDFLAVLEQVRKTRIVTG